MDADGSDVFGMIAGAAFHWSESSSVTLLAPGLHYSEVTDCSGDGSRAIGYVYRTPGGTAEPLLWESGTGLVDMGEMPSNWLMAMNTGISEDGEVVIGLYVDVTANPIGDSRAFLWTATSGFVNLFGPVTGLVDPFPEGQVSSLSISANGNAVGGTDRISATEFRPWIAYLSPPSARVVSSEVCSPAAQNSTGEPGLCQVTGTALIEFDDLALEAAQLPPWRYGMFLLGTEKDATPLAGGTLCIGGDLSRLTQSLASTGALGILRHPIELSQLPFGSGLRPADTGETLFFQAWYRDAAGASGANLTSAAKVIVR